MEVYILKHFISSSNHQALVPVTFSINRIIQIDQKIAALWFRAISHTSIYNCVGYRIRGPSELGTAPAGNLIRRCLAEFVRTLCSYMNAQIPSRSLLEVMQITSSFIRYQACLYPLVDALRTTFSYAVPTPQTPLFTYSTPLQAQKDLHLYRIFNRTVK